MVQVNITYLIDEVQSSAIRKLHGSDNAVGPGHETVARRDAPALWRALGR